MAGVMAIATIVAVLIVAFCYLALTNQPLPFFEALLPPHAASDVYWLMAAASSFCLVPVGALLKRASAPPPLIELAAMAAKVPKASLRGELLTIPYSKISRVEFYEVNGHKFLDIKSSVGESRIISAGFSDEHTFEEFAAALRQRYERSKKQSEQASQSNRSAASTSKMEAGPHSEHGLIRVVTFEELMYEPAPPRYGKRIGTALDKKELAVDKLLDSCFSYIGCKQYNKGPVYVVNADCYSYDEERAKSGTEIVLTKDGVEIHAHNVDRPGDHQISKFEDLKSFLRNYVSREIQMATTREVVHTVGHDAWVQARSSGNWKDLFEKTSRERLRIQNPMENRLEEFLLGDEVAAVARLVDKNQENS